MITLLDIELKLEALREQWRKGSGSREVLKRQARMLELAKEKILKKTNGQAPLISDNSSA